MKAEEALAAEECRVRSLARRLSLRSSVQFDDLAQEGRLGVLRAVREWDESRGPFSAFAWVCMRSAMINLIHGKSERRPPKANPDDLPRQTMTKAEYDEKSPEELAELNRQEYRDELPPQPFEDGLDAPKHFYDPDEGPVVAREEVKQRLAELPPEERTVVEVYYGLDGGQPFAGRGNGGDAAVAKELGTNGRRVITLRQRAVARLRGEGDPPVLPPQRECFRPPTDKQKAASRRGMATTNGQRVRCDGCGRVSTPAGTGRHQACSGHKGRTQVAA